MIKKLIFLAIVALLIWGVWFFFLSARDECTVTLASGVQEQMTVREIRSVYAKDAYNWGMYNGCDITGKGKIEEITNGADDFKSELPYNVVYYTVRVGTGLKLLVTGDQMDGFAVGDKVSFSGTLTTGTNELFVYVMGKKDEPCMVRLP